MDEMNAFYPPEQRELRDRRRGFSLVELVVAVVVLVVLATILFGVGQTVSARARLISCTSNLRNIAAGLIVYAAEHNGDWPYYGEYDDQNAQGSWCTPLMTNVGEWDGLGKIFAVGKIHQSVFFCPQDQSARDEIAREWSNPADGYGSSYLLRGWRQSYEGERPFGKKLIGISHRAVVSCFFAHVKRNPNFVLTRHNGTYPVLYGDGHVSQCHMVDSIDPSNPPDIWDITSLQFAIWDHFDDTK